MTIVVTGARGGVGGEVLAQLVEAGVDVRASSREPDSLDCPAHVERTRLDLDDPRSFETALKGVGSVFLYAHPDTAADFVAVASRCGVEQVVLLSSSAVLRDDAADNPIALRHSVVEAALDQSGMRRGFIRAGYFATNALRWTTIRTDRVLRTAFPDATTPPVHERDIAAVAVHALLHDEDDVAAYAVLGAGPVSVRQQVSAIAQALNETVDLEEVDEETYRSQLQTQLPPVLVDELIRRRGTVEQLPPSVATDVVPELLGRPALTFSKWAADHVDAFR